MVLSLAERKTVPILPESRGISFITLLWEHIQESRSVT